MSRIDTRTALLRERRRCAEELARTLLAGDADPEKPRLLKSRIDTLDAAIAAFPGSRRADYLRVATVGLLALIAISVLVAWNATFLPVVIDIHSRTLTADLATAGNIPLIRLGGHAQVRGSDWVVAPPSLGLNVPAPIDATVEADTLQLDSIEYSAGSVLELQRAPPSLTVGLRSGATTVQLQAYGNIRAGVEAPSGTGSNGATLHGPEVFRFGTDAPAKDRKDNTLLEASLVDRPDDPDAAGTGTEKNKDADSARPADSKSVALVSFALTASSVGFLERAPSLPGESERFESGIVTGTVSFPGMKRGVTLSAGDVLLVDGITEARSTVAIGPDIHFTLSGKVRDLRLSLGGVRRHLAPSMLEYLAEYHGITLAWSSIGFIAGLLWSVSKFVFR
jgi:hypothetical protein